MGAGHLQSTSAQLFGLRWCPRAGRNCSDAPRAGQDSGDVTTAVALGDLRKGTCLWPCPSMPAVGRGDGTWLLHQKTQPDRETNFRGLDVGGLDIEGWFIEIFQMMKQRTRFCHLFPRPAVFYPMAHPQPKATCLQQLLGCLVFKAATRHPPNGPGLPETCCSLLFSERALAT